MADFLGRSAQSLISNGGVAIPGTNLRQELVTEENVQRWVTEGKVFQSSVGTVNTPASFLGAVVAVATPEWAIQIPAGKLVVPLEVALSVITCAAGVWNGPVLIMASNNIGNGTSSAGTDINVNPAFGTGSSGLVVRITYTGAGTTATSPVELFRFGVATAQNPVLLGAPQPPLWSYKTHLAPHIGQTGAMSTFQVNTGQAGAATGYIQVTYGVFNMGDV